MTANHISSKLAESVAIAIFSEDRKQILLIQRRDVPVWVLPGGGIDLGETPEEAAIRETHEETGLDVTLKRSIGLYYPINRLARITHFFECTRISGVLCTGPETLNLAYFQLDNLPKLMPPPYQTWIREAAAFTAPIERHLSELTWWVFIKTLLKHPLFVLRFLGARLKPLR